ncbi:MAG TPA: DoxX family protein [Longimicrobiales bacterium]|nr:DoxX family protein [Longimicrobiales bacterium]
MKTHFNAAAGPTHALLRIVAGLLFMMHGGQKLLGWFGGPGGDGGTVELVSLMGLAGVLELVGGALLIIGLLTRPVAFILSGEMAVAYFMMHFPNGFWPIENRGEPAALFAFIFLYLAFNGAGPWSVDAVRSDRGETAVVTESERAEARSRERAA